MDVGSIFFAALGIGLLIFLHELGHFLAARLAGVRVEVFSLGFGPRLFGVVWRGTDFRVSLVPFGGFVMVAGQDPSDRRYPREQSLWAKGIGQRALFWSGGVLMNALFALLVFPLVFRAGVSFVAPVVGSVAEGSAAWEARLQPGDRITAINGKSVYAIENLMVEVALAGGRPVALDVTGADGQQRIVTANPQYSADAGVYELGIQAAVTTDPPPIEVVAAGPAAVAGLRTGDRLQSVAGQPATSNFAGVVAIDRPVAIEVLRDGATVAAEVTPRGTTEGVPPRIGVAPLMLQIKGLRPGSALVDRLQLRHGDRILAIDGKPFLDGDLAAAPGSSTHTRWRLLRNGEAMVVEAEASAAERAALAEHIALQPDLASVFVLPMPDTAAAAAGVLPGDRIVAIDDQPVAAWRDLVELVTAAHERPLRVRVQHLPATAGEDALLQPNGPIVDLVVAPRVEPQPDLGLTYSLAHVQDEVQAATIGEAVRLGTVCSLDLVKQLYVTLKRLLTGDVAAKNLSGIIRIGQVSYQAAQRGPSWFWYFLALLSVNLAFVNLLPVPVLDGGYLLFLLIEKVKGSPVSTKVLGYSQIIGLVFVLLLVLFVTYNDILRLL